MYPIVLDLRGRLAVVVGGGAVGRRKAASLLAAGARVRLICLELPPEPAAGLDWLTDAYRPEHLDGAVLVFAAATAEVNRSVVADARARGLWVCSATEPGDGDFVVPAVVRRGELTVAVSTGGAAPAAAAALRRHLETVVDDAFGWWVALLAELRPAVLALPETIQPVAWQRLCEMGWVERLRAEGVQAVRPDMAAVVAALETETEPPV
jgi:siroheme synthase-like protein